MFKKVARLKHGGNPLIDHETGESLQSTNQLTGIVQGMADFQPFVDVLAETLYPTKSRDCLLYTSPSPRDVEESRMPSSA